MSEQIDWQAISAALRAPFDPADVDFRVQGKANAEGKAQVVAYVDARTVQDRLDEVVGPGAWSFTWEPVTLANNELHVVKGSLTIHGVTREDVGTASNFDPSKGAVSDALKRAAVAFGVGRYLYAIPSAWVSVNKDRILPSTVTQLRASLPRPDGSAPQPAAHTSPARPTAPSVASERPQPPQQPTRPQRPPAPSQRDAGRPTDGHDDEDATIAPPTDAQAKAIARLSAALGRSTPVFTTFTEASRLISELQEQVRKQNASQSDHQSEQHDSHDLSEAFPAGQRGA